MKATPFVAGEKHVNAKLTDHEVQQIKVLLRSTQYKHRTLARKFNISISTIKAISRGFIWRHIPWEE